MDQRRKARTLSKRRAYARDPERFREHQRRYRLRFPERVACRNALRRAILAGLIERPRRCEIPGCRLRPQAHHVRYDRPLAVQWLCSGHHGVAHSRVPREARRAA
jgi:hypothetical protein